MFEPNTLWRGRGFPVRASVNGVSFKSAIFSLQRKFYVLIEAGVRKAGRVPEGVLARITLEPYDEK
ncbi:MAG: DUF1905 domain-containing protein [Pyrinomonadaceae bacterium]